MVQARDITSQTWDVVSTKSVAIYGQGISLISEGYSTLPPQVREFSDPALEATSKYTKLGLAKVKEGYNQLADVIVEQYYSNLPTINLYWKQVKSGAQNLGAQALDHGTKVTNSVSEIVLDTYDKVSPQVRKCLLLLEATHS